MTNKPSLVKLDANQLRELVNYLLGSSNSIYEGLETIGLTYEQVATESWHAINAKIFKCGDCGFWIREDESVEDYSCIDCFQESMDTEDDKFFDNEDNALDDGDDL